MALGAVSFAASIALLQTKRHGYAAVTLTISFAVAGCLLSFSERTKATTGRLLSLYETNVINSDDPVELTGKLVTPPEPAPGGCYLDTEAEGIRVHDDVMPATGRARLMIMPSDDQAEIELADLSLDYGSRIRVLMRLERAHVYANPGSPDFNEFLERHGYDLKGVIKSPLLIERIGDGPRNPALAFLYQLRLRIMRAIDSTFESKIAGTLKAMLTGNRYFLDPETVERLREGSTFHTLVIAGLHIGIIAWALLGGRSALKRRRVARVIVCLLVLWTYAYALNDDDNFGAAGAAGVQECCVHQHSRAGCFCDARLETGSGGRSWVSVEFRGRCRNRRARVTASGEASANRRVASNRAYTPSAFVSAVASQCRGGAVLE